MTESLERLKFVDPGNQQTHPYPGAICFHCSHAYIKESSILGASEDRRRCNHPSLGGDRDPVLGIRSTPSCKEARTEPRLCGGRLFEADSAPGDLLYDEAVAYIGADDIVLHRPAYRSEPIWMHREDAAKMGGHNTPGDAAKHEARRGDDVTVHTPQGDCVGVIKKVEGDTATVKFWPPRGAPTFLPFNVETGRLTRPGPYSMSRSTWSGEA